MRGERPRAARAGGRGEGRATKPWSAIWKTLAFTVLVPGTVAGVVPWLLAQREPASWEGGWSVAMGAAVLLAGVVLYGKCAWDFAARGSGTPAPVDPPKRFVAEGLYRYSRNPMYLGVLLAILGHGLILASPRVFAYGALMWLVFHGFVRLYEERELSRRFGAEYDEYRRRVPRWIGMPRRSNVRGLPR